MIEITKKDRESTASVLRRFSRKVRQSGVLFNARKNRFHNKPLNKFAQRSTALRRERLRAMRRQLLKTGEIAEREKIDLSKVKGKV